MFELSVGSLVFALFMIMAPFLLRNNFKYRNILFLCMNLFLYIGGIKAWQQAIVAGVWIVLPYIFVKRKMQWKAPVIIVMLICFAYLMQYDWIFGLLHIPYLFALKLLGLSYFLFRQIDFIMQYEYMKETKVRITFLDYSNYLLSFWTLLAGPILRYEDFVTDFYEEKELIQKEEIFFCLNRALNGYLKVFVVSSMIMYYATKWFDGLGTHGSAIKEVLAFVIFAFLNGWYIYFNFSGYCDIVISLSKLSGFTVRENFNQPYLSRSVVEFWNRHHITLSEWIRDYIYSPLFKNLISGPCQKNIRLGQYLALFITFTIAGIWHGTNSNYLVYGIFQGLGIVGSMLYKEILKKKLGKQKFKKYEENRFVKIVETCVTWMYICLTFSFVGFDVVGLLKG
ncbi:MAG: MBOAT family protein [Lachnospiraceae bacterium]|nr:MBOAT family protein [Lachnospiraceae bacterium]